MRDDEPPTLDLGGRRDADQEKTDVEGTTLAPGTDVGGYRIESILGSGGMGVVYAATHPLIGKRAAVKVLRPELSKEPAAIQRFVTEARAVNQIGHPNIVDIFAFGELPDGRSYYLMDLLVGESLRARLRRTGAVHISEAASFVDEIASALMAAHDKGIIHRDLKPDNVFMMSVPGRWPEVRLLDWGLAKLAAPAGKFRTVTGSMLGTPVYMSPEQARAADTVDARTDIYALGVMAYELLCGEPPFRRGSSIDTLLAHQEDEVPPLGARVPGLPEELVQLIEAMLAKDADQRPTLAAVRTVLKRLKGTKIPTMTAAGISMELPPQRTEHDPDEGMITVDQKRSEMTVPGFESELRTGQARGRPQLDDPPTLSTPRTITGVRAPIGAAPERPTAPALKRKSDEYSSEFGSQWSGTQLPAIGRAPTPQPAIGRAPTPQPAVGRAPTPIPAPAVGRTPTPIPAPVVGRAPTPIPLGPQSSVLPLPPPPEPPRAVGSVPPQVFESFPSMHIEYPQESQPAMPAHAGPQNSRRVIVILIVAIVLSGIGIALALAL